MLYRCGNIISDGTRAKIVPANFTNWHSDMSIDDIPGSETTPFHYPETPKLDIVIKKPVDFSWLPKKRFCHRPYVTPKKYL